MFCTKGSVPNSAQIETKENLKGKLIFSQFSDKDTMEHLLGFNSWHLSKYAELTEVVRLNEKCLSTR